MSEVEATEPAFGVNVGKVRLAGVHDPSKCEGRPCCIHHPSNHHMVTWPQVWRGDKSTMERKCPHGIGHPDPDDLAYHESRGVTWVGVHGCDGCCVDRTRA